MPICPFCSRDISDHTMRTSCPEEARGSRMPPHMESLDPTFLDALEKVPETVREEKEER